MKKCNLCKDLKSINEFFKSSRNKDGYENRCKICKIGVNKQSYIYNKEEIKLRSIKKKYKLEAEDYYELISNGCEICGSFDSLCIDHNHLCCDKNVTCGVCIRGVLCRRCNMAEGLFKNDGNNIQNLIKYMQKHGIINENKEEI